MEKRTVTARNKAFLFLSVDTAMFKLRDSLEELVGLAARQPSCYRVGAHGWVTVTFSADTAPSMGLFKKWIDESYRVVVSKQPVASPADGGSPAAKKKAARKKTASR